MRAFPYEHEATKEILFHPGKPDVFDGDILEIGPGRGDFVLSTAGRHPDKKIVAIELSKRRYFKLARRVDRNDLTNVLLVQGNARIILPNYFPPETFEKIYVLFPDPWPKRRHIPQRLMSIDFITLLAERLKTGGSLFFATDFWSYADWVIDNIRSVTSLRSLGRPYFTTIDDMDDYGPSFYEQKWRDEGRAIYYMRYEKIGG
jgi:tRNA (guanine-N7-)-methyltransferase